MLGSVSSADTVKKPGDFKGLERSKLGGGRSFFNVSPSEPERSGGRVFYFAKMLIVEEILPQNQALTENRPAFLTYFPVFGRERFHLIQLIQTLKCEQAV
jgi:hypothetical protein